MCSSGSQAINRVENLIRFSERFNQEKAASIGVKGFPTKPIVESDMAKMARKVLDEPKDATEGQLSNS